MTQLSQQIWELAGKLKSDCPNAPYLPMSVQHLPTILAALELYERMEAPGCVEEVAAAIIHAEDEVSGMPSERAYPLIAQAAISAMKGEK